ncbi:MAG: Hsp70 family protein, partial [Micromonosporaceae bacterium]|nr:Hsp70 family protein [Micromonosporaceae bacterium]
MGQGIRLGIDYGTSNTVSVLHIPGRPNRVLLFDGSPQLPSAVFADPGAGLLTGRDATHAARTDPTRVEPNPKRRISDQVVLLGGSEVPVEALIAATVSRVRDEAHRVCGTPVSEVVLTHPASWGPRRRGVLVAGVRSAGLAQPMLVPEPVAAAAYFVEVLGADVPIGRCLVVYDFGAGTFDASIVRRTDRGFSVLATEGLPDTGGLDIDAAIVALLWATQRGWDPAQLARLENPQTAEDRRSRELLWQDARTAKEMLSRASSTFIHVPLVDADVPLGREQFEALARPVLEETMAATIRAVRASGVAASEIGGVFPVGGSSRIPLAATLLHRALGIAPTVLDQPELVVAEGAALAVPAPQCPPVVSGPPAQPVLVSAGGRAVGSAAIQPMSPGARSGGAYPDRRYGRIPLIAMITIFIALVTGICGYLVVDARRDSRIDGPGTAATEATSPADLTFPASMTGVWSGNLQQSDGKVWPMQVSIP